jgi:hypothetical protein
MHQYPANDAGSSATQGAAAVQAVTPAMSQAAVPTPATLGITGLDAFARNAIFSPNLDAVLDGEVNPNLSVDDMIDNMEEV